MPGQTGTDYKEGKTSIPGWSDRQQLDGRTKYCVEVSNISLIKRKKCVKNDY